MLFSSRQCIHIISNSEKCMYQRCYQDGSRTNKKWQLWNMKIWNAGDKVVWAHEVSEWILTHNIIIWVTMFISKALTYIHGITKWKYVAFPNFCEFGETPRLKIATDRSTNSGWTFYLSFSFFLFYFIYLLHWRFI